MYKKNKGFITFIAFILVILINTWALASTTTIVVSVAKGQLRQTPNSKAKVVYNIKKGTSFTSSKTSKKWYQVKYKNKNYWIYSKQVTVKKSTKTVPNNGYKIPTDNDVKVDTPKGDPYKVELEAYILVYKDLSPQYQDLQKILSSKFDSKTINEVMVYVKQKTDQDQELTQKKIKANGKTISIMSNAGDLEIEILVYGY